VVTENMSDNKITNQNTRWHEPTIKRHHREALNEHKGKILWFTGLSGAGKSTLAHALEEQLHDYGARTYVLDGDNVRKGLCKDLGFSEQDRVENIRRIGEMSRIMMDAGLIVMTAFISPFRRDRRIVRELVETGDFISIFAVLSAIFNNSMTRSLLLWHWKTASKPSITPSAIRTLSPILNSCSGNSTMPSLSSRARNSSIKISGILAGNCPNLTSKNTPIVDRIGPQSSV